MGIVCSNAFVKRGTYAQCSGCWCGDCYSLPDDGYFKIRNASEDNHSEDLFVDVLMEEVFWFLSARSGDGLMIKFKCDACVFINLKKRHASLGGEDKLLLRFIRRDTLDAFW